MLTSLEVQSKPQPSSHFQYKERPLIPPTCSEESFELEVPPPARDDPAAPRDAYEEDRHLDVLGRDCGGRGAGDAPAESEHKQRQQYDVEGVAGDLANG